VASAVALLRVVDLADPDVKPGDDRDGGSDLEG